jgi:hypothetical protein
MHTHIIPASEAQGGRVGHRVRHVVQHSLAHTHTHTHAHAHAHTHTHTQLSLGRVGCFEHTLESRREPLLKDTHNMPTHTNIQKDTIVMRYVVYPHHCRFRPPPASDSKGVVPSAHLRLSDCLHRGLTLECRAPLWVGVPIHHTRYTHTRSHAHMHTCTHTHARAHTRDTKLSSGSIVCLDIFIYPNTSGSRRESHTQALIGQGV